MVNNLRLSLTAGRTSSLRSVGQRPSACLNSRSDFRQKSTRIHLPYRRIKKTVEFVMRRHAVILAAALAWLVSIEGAEARLDILVDKGTQRMLVMQDGYMRYIWPVSTGRDEMATPNGVYTPQRLERNWFSTAYYNSPMPYAIFFHNGYAIHGSYAIDRLGGPASHGCVRLHPHHAALLFDLVQQEGPDKTTIEVTDEAGPRQPPSPPREIAAGQGPYPPVQGIVRYRDTGDMPEPPAAQRGNRLEEPPLPPREIAAGRGPYQPVQRLARYRETGDIPEPPAAQRGNRLEEPLLPPRVIAAGRGSYPLLQRLARYRDNGDMPGSPPAQRGTRSLVARNASPPLPLPLPPPPASRRVLADVRPPASAPRAPCGAGESDTANESADCRPKPKVAEAPPPAQPQQAQAPPPTIYGFKLLPASCWSGGASRWRMWGSSQGAACK
jgi:L,D-transpeptidase-like protein